LRIAVAGIEDIVIGATRDENSARMTIAWSDCRAAPYRGQLKAVKAPDNAYAARWSMAPD
jgi:hypothetical protein